MNSTCKNCGKPIRVSIFKGGDWCSDLCRKALFLKHVADRSKRKCEYEEVDLVGLEDPVAVCVVHASQSKYPSSRGENRPCLAVEGY